MIVVTSASRSWPEPDRRVFCEGFAAVSHDLFTNLDVGEPPAAHVLALDLDDPRAAPRWLDARDHAAVPADFARLKTLLHGLAAPDATRPRDRPARAADAKVLTRSAFDPRRARGRRRMSSRPASSEPTPVQTAHVVLAREASIRGFKNALAFKRFCDRVGIPIYKVGKLLFVQPAEVDAGISRGAVSRPGASSNESVQRAIEQLTHRR